MDTLTPELTFGTHYEDVNGPTVVMIKFPTLHADGTYWAAVSIKGYLTEAKIAGETPLASYWYATQFAMSHLHMLCSEGKISISRDMQRSIANWHQQHPDSH